MQIVINGNIRQFDQKQFTVAELIKTLNVTGKRIAVECNGEIVPKSLFAETILHEGDRLEIVGAVGGG